ncbi:nucleotidyltransferase domain-containing protein [Nocardiopsis sp. B62]|uniref:nucleotidyltransferase domain-containing protein n=1 Tax=Nocardiopsis sp. B62 TaxID=2824874 RepID=UPI001B365014|nr:nucleotidyltransferase domain-containing protein [Nocardiopsis sp. B62]MBQ1079928.1 nucleotidyltransferase domain-containing protein [Nocardiopsis sp. B62]
MTPPPVRGLRPDGTIAREGSTDRVHTAFTPVVETLRTRLHQVFGPRMHSAYLYGSIPRGTAVPGVSDLDALVALHTDPTPTDRDRARALLEEIDTDFPQVDGGGILLDGVPTLTSELERHDSGFFVACLCTPLTGPDLARQLPRYRPTSLLARETNGDLHLTLRRWRTRLAEATTDDQLRALSRGVSRRLTRTGLTLVMPAWGGWTSDLTLAAEVFGHYHPGRHEQMRAAAHTARHPSADRDHLVDLLEDLAPWLAEEYTATHGPKAPRPATPHT